MSTRPSAGPPSVVVVGESIVDIVVSATGSVAHAGGSPLNVAVGVSRLEIPVDFITYLADDAHGHLLRAHLESSGVRSISTAPGSPAATPTAAVTLQSDGSAHYAFDLHWEMPPVDPGALDHGLLHVGSIAALLSPGAAAVEALIGSVRDRMLVTYDPNIRPQIIGSREEVLDDVERFFRAAHLVKASAEDLHWLYPEDSLADAAQRVRESGPTIVVVTDGGEATIVATSDGVVRTPSRRVEVVDTIGAGDSFMAGVIGSLIDQGVVERFAHDPAAALASIDVSRMVEMATSCAAITVTRAGANPPRRAELPG
jgi:fructokinase